jgi:hypothetical protein
MADALRLLGGTVAVDHGLAEEVQFAAQFVEAVVQVVKACLIGQRFGFVQAFEVIGSLVAGSEGVGQKTDKVRFVVPSTIALDGI